MMTETKTARWHVRDVDSETIHKIKLYAVQHNMNMAEALDAIVKIALTK